MYRLMDGGENVELICSSNTWHLLHSTDYLLTLLSGVNVPCLSNKNSLERQLPQVKLGSFPDSALLSVSIETLSIYLGKLKQLLSSLTQSWHKACRHIHHYKKTGVVLVDFFYRKGWNKNALCKYTGKVHANICFLRTKPPNSPIQITMYKENPISVCSLKKGAGLEVLEETEPDTKPSPWWRPWACESLTAQYIWSNATEGTDVNNIHFSSRAVIMEIYDSPLYRCPGISNKSHSTTESCSGQKGKRKIAVEGGPTHE